MIERRLQPAFEIEKSLNVCEYVIAAGGKFHEIVHAKKKFSFSFLILLVVPNLYAASKGGCIPAAYLIVEESGTQSLRTFSGDGTIQIASSAQGALNLAMDMAHGNNPGVAKPGQPFWILITATPASMAVFLHPALRA